MKRTSQVRQSIAVSAVLMAALFLLPLAVMVPFRSELFSGDVPVDETEGDPFVSGDLDQQTTLKVLDGEQVLEMDLGTYLVGVVRAEMPASFEPEALKAQAVAARTYTLYNRAAGITEKQRISVQILLAVRHTFRRRRHGRTGERPRMPMRKKWNRPSP